MKKFEQSRARKLARHASVQEGLRLLQGHVELIFNAVSDGILALDADENIMFANPRAAELLGWRLDELLGQPAHGTLHRRTGDHRFCPIESSLVPIRMGEGALRRVSNDVFPRKDGTSFRVDYACAPMMDGQGQVMGSIVIFQDTTEEVIGESRLKLQEQQYRMLFETNPSPMWVFDTKSLEILAVNEAALAQYGYSREEFLKLTLRDLRPGEEVPDLVKAMTSPQVPAHFSGQFRHIRKDGSIILVEVYSAGIVWKGVPARIVTAIDISKRQRPPNGRRNSSRIRI